MDRSSKILMGVFGILLIGSIGMSYYRYIVVHDYVITAEVYCDPRVERCFMSVCDTSDETAECTGDPEEDTSYYKIVQRNAQHIPSCDPMTADCAASVCRIDEEECDIELCDVTIDPEAMCSDPDTYQAMQDEKISDEDEMVIDALDRENGSDTGDTADTQSMPGEDQ